MVVYHKFQSQDVASDVRTLFVGTFNPGADGNDATFFYSRSRNWLWEYLPLAFGEPSLKHAPRELKLVFMRSHQIGFVDLIHAVDVPKDEASNFSDKFIDDKVHIWNTDSVLELISNRPDLRRVAFTRATFNDVPNIKREKKRVEIMCAELKLSYSELQTPARFRSEAKRSQYETFLNLERV